VEDSSSQATTEDAPSNPFADAAVAGGQQIGGAITDSFASLQQTLQGYGTYVVIGFGLLLAVMLIKL
jgi:hypothetical protein